MYGHQADTERAFAVVEAAEARSPRSSAFLDHCRALQGGRAFPRWRDFKLHRLATDVIPYMAVVDVDHARNAFTYRFWGTGHTALKGVDMTGRRVAEIAAAGMAQIGQRQYEMVLAERRPLVFVHALTGYGPWKDHIQVAVRVPFSDDGDAIDKVVSYSNYDEDREAWADLYRLQVRDSGRKRAVAGR